MARSNHLTREQHLGPEGVRRLEEVIAYLDEEHARWAGRTPLLRRWWEAVAVDCSLALEHTKRLLSRRTR